MEERHRKRKRITLTALLCILALLASYVGAALAVSGKSSPPALRRELLDDTAVADLWSYTGDVLCEWKADEPVTVAVGDSLEIPLTVPEAGTYRLALCYAMPSYAVQEQMLLVEAGGEQVVSPLRFLWTDAEGGYPEDRYGNQTAPNQELLDALVTDVLLDSASLTGVGASFSLEAGEQTVRLTPQTLDLLLCGLYLLPEETFAAVSGGGQAGEPAVITVEAEYYRAKSDSYIRPDGYKDPALTPYDTSKRYMNVLEGSSFSTAGQKILWEFEVESSGYYAVTFHYHQDGNTNLPVFRQVEIDGRIPSAAWESVEFPYCSSSRFTQLQVSSEEGGTARVWLEPGIHTLALTAVGTPVDGIYQQILEMLDRINDIGIAVRKLTGNNADANRTWQVEEYLPTIRTDLEEIRDDLFALYTQLEQVCGEKPVFADGLKYAVKTMEELLEDLRTFPNKMDQFCEGSGSVAQTVGDLLLALDDMPLSLDTIVLTSGGATAPQTDVGFLVRSGAAIQSFLYSFDTEARSAAYEAGTQTSDGALTVWVNRPVQYVEIMQQMIDSQFTSETGIRVNLSIMPNEQKLILANASGNQPDMALGVAFYTPYDFAIRGAVKNLLEFDDFLPWYNEEFNLESLLPMCFNNGVYGAVETQDFYVLMYRKDILEEFGIGVPDTWDDVRAMMPVLRQYGMSFNTILSNMSGTRNFTATSPFIYQNGGEFYTADGAASAFTTENTATGFSEMTDLFRVYGVSTYIPSFFNGMRYGTVPVGIGTFSTYLQLQVAAPELASQWGIALAPGTELDGEVVRYQNADGTAGMIFNSDETTERQCFELLKWWLSADVQTEFAYSIQSFYGPEFLWNTANLKAFENLSYPAEDKAVILEQWTWQRENVRHPATYMVEREASNVFTGVVVEKENLRQALDRAQSNSDMEILRKLQEFGFVDENGEVLEEYPIDTIAYLRSLLGE